MPTDVRSREALRLRVRGVVQGVGFRPFVWRLARRLALGGRVSNDAEGVRIEAVGERGALTAFVAALRAEAPPAARVEAVEVLERRPAIAGDPADFAIVASEGGTAVTTLVSPDLPVCDACLRELRDEDDRRYRYPYINCTHCGPRYSIITALPYDRANTSMRTFPLCDACAAEYADPADRRYHAQPVACPVCGPALRLLDGAGLELARGDAVIDGAAWLLRCGRIVALKGLGGYHLACDARDAGAVDALRVRKFRKEKPFALMAIDEAALADVVELDDAARELLASAARPIVLLPKGPEPLSAALAPGNADLGVMLPYTPLHHLLFDAGAPPLLVMTSANRSSEPIAYRDDEALDRLRGLADDFVVGERPIVRRVDDSVATLLGGRPAILRRARGWAPAPVVDDARYRTPRLGLGAMLKNSVALATAGRVFVSQHLGDLDHWDAYRAFQETIADLCALYRLEPAALPLVADLHPDYPSTRYAAELGGPLLRVQHHRAHIASVLAERGAWDAPVVGFAFDGAGLGEDGAIWGGEAFRGTLLGGLERVAHQAPAPLPGGDAAARFPAQAAAGFLHDVDAELWRARLPEAPVRVARALVESGFNTPATTSVGRLFDAAAALLGFDRPMTFEGQAAVWLESLARRSAAAGAYPWPFDGRSWAPRALLVALLDDLARGTCAADAARRFHRGVAEGVVAAAQRLAAPHGIATVCLSGGVWQNRLLHALALEGLEHAGFRVWWNERVPLGDGGIALGQVALAAAAAPGSDAKEA